MKTPLLLALATAVGLPLASAQDERRPENPPRSPDAERPPGPRPDGDRPAQRTERRPDGDRGPGRRAEGHGLEAPNPEGRRPEGERRAAPRPGGERRDDARVEIDARGGGATAQARAEASVGMPRPQKPTAYLGVATAEVPPALAAQLGLSEGFGLVVDEVVPESPAAKAGVQRFDVIKQFNDQHLTDPNQLAALVRSVGKDTEVTLTLIRKGTEQKVAMKVGERMLPERRPFGDADQLMRNLAPMRERVERGAREMREQMENWNGEFGERMKQYQERMKEYTNRLHEFHERNKGGQNPGETPPKAPEPPVPPTPPVPPRSNSRLEPAPADVLRPLRPGGAPRVRVEQDGNVTTWNTANARAVMKDDDGEVELRSENGKRTVTARDRDGKEVFNGPIDTDEQRAALPENVRRKIERMEIKTDSRRGGGVSADAAAHGGGVVIKVPGPVRGGEREIQ